MTSAANQSPRESGGSLLDWGTALSSENSQRGTMMIKPRLWPGPCPEQRNIRSLPGSGKSKHITGGPTVHHHVHLVMVQEPVNIWWLLSFHLTRSCGHLTVKVLIIQGFSFMWTITLGFLRPVVLWPYTIYLTDADKCTDLRGASC